LDIFQQRLIALLVELARDDPQRPAVARLVIVELGFDEHQAMEPNRRAGVPAPAPGCLTRPQKRLKRLPIHAQRQPRVGRGRVGELDRLMLGDQRQFI